MKSTLRMILAKVGKNARISKLPRAGKDFRVRAKKTL
jgi:hypothetical protein